MIETVSCYKTRRHLHLT